MLSSSRLRRGRGGNQMKPQTHLADRSELLSFVNAALLVVCTESLFPTPRHVINKITVHIFHKIGLCQRERRKQVASNKLVSRFEMVTLSTIDDIRYVPPSPTSSDLSGRCVSVTLESCDVERRAWRCDFPPQLCLFWGGFTVEITEILR